MRTKDEQIFASHVTTLARFNDDARDGYAAAADHARNASLSKRLLKWSEERGEFAAALCREGALSPANPTPTGTKPAAVHRAWMGLRYFVGGSDDALLEECLRGETTAIAAYEHVLARGDFSARTNFRTLLATQLASVRSQASELERELVTRIGSKDKTAILRRARVFVQSHHTLTLATTGDAGPWSSAVSYVNDGFTFYFVSDPTCRHAVNLERDPRVAATIHDDVAAWMDIRGLQLEGRAEIVSDLSTRADVLAKLFSRFPFLHSMEGEARDVAVASSYALYKITPYCVWLIDHHRGAHARFELDLSRPSDE